MKWISVLGDSMSTFKGYNPNGYNVFYNDEMILKSGMKSVEDTWWYKVIKALDGQLCVNNSYSGSMVTGSDFPSASCDERIQKLCNALHKPDIILVYIGFNDFGYNVRVKPLPSNPQSTLSFEYAYDLMLEKIIANYPNAKIMCSTIIRGFVKGSEEDVFPCYFWGSNIFEFNTAIRDVCKKRNVILVDMDAAGVHSETIEGAHPTAAGHDTIAKLWLDCMKGNI